jgi:hypothetical protein
MARTNGGLIGKRNVTSFGKCATTNITSSGNHTTQPGTRLVGGVYVAGGGGGGRAYGGGGGGGGLIMTPLSQGLPVCGNTAYPVVIGGGGAGGTGCSDFGTTGVDTTGFGFTAKGGGKGALAGQGPATDGGSGGGSGNACRPNCTAGAGIQPIQPGLSGVFGFGNRGGGSIAPGSAPDYAQGGGGGAGGAGNIATNPPLLGGVGGNGKDVTPIYSTGGTYAGGGGGGAQASGGGVVGGPGGGGDAGNSPGQSPYTGEAGTTNTGGGGGGASFRPSPAADQTRSGGAGGSGIVIVKELNKASGVWNLRSQFSAIKQGTWPDGTVVLGVDLNYLVVAGGGGSPSGAHVGGGGGAGGYRAAGFGPSPLRGSAVSGLTTGSYTVTVGGGGSGTCGSDSIFSTITSTGGGRSGTSGAGSGQAGGSGGGATGGNFNDGCGGAGNTPPTDPPQGNAGGNDSRPGDGDNVGAGGGGGATAVGANANNCAGNGGAGAPNTILGPDTTYAGGGGGANYLNGTAGSGGAGGGGCGVVYQSSPPQPTTNTAGDANTGGGAGGGALTNIAGGSGIVVVRGPSALTFAGSPCCAFTGSTHPGGDKIAKFTASGTLTISK